MKTISSPILTTSLGVVLCASAAQATIYSYDFNTGFDSGTTVADANTTGWYDSRDINVGAVDQIQGLTVRLNLGGGFNGDLYGYLVLTDTATHTTLAFSTLLNRVGQGTGSQPTLSFGYADAGMNVAFHDGAANGSIHNYQDLGGGYPTAIANGSAFQTDGGSLGVFSGQGANHTWTLFLSDLSGGSVTTVNGWGLDVDVVPEPTTWALIGFAALVAGGQAATWLRRRQAA